MNKKHWSMIMGALLLASCQESEHAPAAGNAAAPAESAAPATGAASADGAVTKGKPIQPGVYRVCQDDGKDGHGSVEGPHLSVDEKVQITPFGAQATKVCLKKECPPPGNHPPASDVKVIWMAGDANLLAGESTFDHTDNAGTTTPVTHFVRIFDNPADHGETAGACTKPNVLTIQFCTEDELSGELTCLGAGPHLGHVHVEN